MINVKIGGVPEHFNFPWLYAIQNEVFSKRGINVIWEDIPEGTGLMCEKLKNDELDIAIVLTEGIVKSISEGNPSSICQTYVESPLIWGIHVAHDSQFETINDLKGKTAAISRFGSGSHLMSYVNANDNNWDLENDLNFKVLNNINQAAEGLTNNEADYFLWEKFTTQPLVNKKIFRRIGTCPTPWPCFVIAANNNFIEGNKSTLNIILEEINKVHDKLSNKKNTYKLISSHYNLEKEEVKEWISKTKWSKLQISQENIISTLKFLKKLNLIKDISKNKFIY